MNITRRQFIAQSAALTLASPCLFGATKTPVIPLVNGPEVESYQRAQKAVLVKYGVKAESKYLRLDRPSLRVHVLVAGKGEPVVLIHGGAAMAVQFAPLLAGLQEKFQCFAPDRPGCGLTDKIDYTELTIPFRQHAVDVVRSLLDELKLPKAVIAGNSMGGYWALVFALAAPKRVSKLILLGGVAGSPPPPTRRLPPHTGVPSLQDTQFVYKEFLMADGARASREMLEADVAAQSLPGAALGWNSMLELGSREGWYDKGLTYSLRPELRRLKPPTLFLWGERDIEGPPSLAQEMAALAPNARCEVVPDSGHLIWLDQPGRCSKLVSDFLKSV